MKKILPSLLLVYSLWSIVYSPLFAQSLPSIIQILEQEPQDLDAIEELIRYHWHDKALGALQKYPPDEPRVVYLKGLGFFGKKLYEEALGLFEQISDPKYLGQARFKKAQTLSRLKRYSESLKLYQKLLKEAKGWRAKDHLRWAGFKTALEAKQYEEGLQFLLAVKSIKASWWRGWCYFRLGDFERATKSWGQIPARRSFGFYPKALFWQAQILEKQGNTKAAQETWATLLEKFPQTYYGLLAQREANPREEFSYPLDFVDVIKKESKRRKLDPLLVMALIRQESNFNPQAVSPSGAMGLMQMIPQTALRLVKATKQKKFQWPRMFDPAVNIKLGTFYLKFLYELFDKELPYALAAYNAGEEAVSRWLILRKEESVLYFIEEIPYEQTQVYTQKVLTNYWLLQSKEP